MFFHIMVHTHLLWLIVEIGKYLVTKIHCVPQFSVLLLVAKFPVLWFFSTFKLLLVGYFVFYCDIVPVAVKFAKCSKT